MPTEHKYTILAVDDYEPHRYALSHMLERAGFKVLTAGSGAETLKQATSRPDLILLDIGLPDISGLDVCDRLKDDPETADVPIIFVTATHPQEFFLLESQKRGARALLTYPLDGEMLLDVIRACLQQLEPQPKE